MSSLFTVSNIVIATGIPRLVNTDSLSKTFNELELKQLVDVTESFYHTELTSTIGKQTRGKSTPFHHS